MEELTLSFFRVFSFISLIFFLPGLSGPSFSQEPPGPAPVALTLGRFSGAAEIQAAGGVWRRPAVAMALEEGDRLRTGAGGRAEIIREDGTVTLVEPQTEVRISSITFLLDERGAVKKLETDLRLEGGTLLAAVAKPRYAIRTPLVTVAVRGTELAVAAPDKDTTDIAVFEGELLFRPIEELATLHRGLPTDPTALLQEFVTEISLKRDRQVRISRKTGTGKTEKLAGPMLQNKEVLRRNQGRISEIRRDLAETDAEARWARARQTRRRVLGR